MIAGVPREARTLSGCDIGRIVTLASGATGVLHLLRQGHAITDVRLGLTTYTLRPHDIVTVRGRES